MKSCVDLRVFGPKMLNSWSSSTAVCVSSTVSRPPSSISRPGRAEIQVDEAVRYPDSEVC